MLSKLFKIVLAIFLLLAITIGLASINHPIILNWVTGAARHFGKPATTTVYANGKLNERIKIYYTDEPKNYLVSLAEFDTSGLFTFLNINLQEKWIGNPVAMSGKDYGFIAGHLFINKSAAHFSPFQDSIKKANFDSQLIFEGS